LAGIYQNRYQDPVKAAEHVEKFRAGMERLKAQRQGKADAPAPQGTPAGASAGPAAVAPISTAFDPAGLPPARTDATFAVIVSGLPRSGTSLMMQMLDAGGIPALQDNHRPPDADNPRGYFEFAPARNLRADSSWLPLSQGRSLKLVAQLLPWLPPGREYRVIFMERSLDDVLASQSVMLGRHGRAGAALTPEKLRIVFTQQLEMVNEALQRPVFKCLRVSHAECLKDAAGVARRVTDFLGLPLNRAAMAAVVDPSLHRQKRGAKEER
jgi:hypothetical protein